MKKSESLTIVFARPNFGYLVDKSYHCTTRCLCESVVFSIYDREITTRGTRIGKSCVRVKWPGKLHEELKVVLYQSFRYTFCIALDDVRAIRQRSFDILDKIYRREIFGEQFLLNL